MTAGCDPASVDQALRTALEEGAASMGFALAPQQLQTLIDFLALLQKWNRVYNLTSVRDPADMLRLHLLDSLAAVAPLQRYLTSTHGSGARRLLDVGSGGGLPGVVFAACLPELSVSCVDTVGKKAAFVQQAALGLGLKNLTGIHARVETIKGPYDVISSRAFASLADFTQWSAQALASDGVWLAMKGRHPEEELAELPASVEVFHVEQVSVPQLDAERCLVWMRARTSPGDSCFHAAVVT